ncbi:helix-turn-helix transcriptional regulator [Pseudomonas sp. V1]|uniref:winged helix-turn-helix transcriptional regulator n=1 Tax=Pseudomonas arcuscaelestis TaxID=2710591 RepID=UPI0019400614|nr:helix-turn-helix domain-containing protein [Pseudomonas arcuscaelestis]MBM3107299.1 helix-turn-helix transcriptional regulator [Pseudomonas arcuscaelestis]
MGPNAPVSEAFSTVVRRGDLLSADCPSRDVLKHMTSRWGVLVLVMLLGGMHRFNELRRKIGGVSEKMLSQTLQALELDGLIARKALPVVPPHVEYSLTPLGQEAAQHLEVMVDWIENNLPEIMSRRREAQASSPENPA